MSKDVSKSDTKESTLAVEIVDGQPTYKFEATAENVKEAFRAMTGLSDDNADAAISMLLNQAANSANTGENQADKIYNSIFPLLREIDPKDGIEGMLAVQMIAAHNLSMEMSRRGLSTGSAQASKAINEAVKLMRTFTAQMEALQKYRNKGKQTIHVEHVTVNEGGQAVVGSVTGGGNG